MIIYYIWGIIMGVVLVFVGFILLAVKLAKNHPQIFEDTMKNLPNTPEGLRTKEMLRKKLKERKKNGIR